MKKIKLFFIRNYQRLLRFFILFSVISCVALSGLTASALGAQYEFAPAQPQLTGNDCYVEFLTSDGGAYCVYVKLYAGVVNDPDTFHSTTINTSFIAYIDGNDLAISPSEYAPVPSLSGFGFGAWGNTIGLYNHGSKISFYLGSAKIIGIHGYNCKVLDSVPNDTIFSFSYGTDSAIQRKIDNINATVESFKGQNQQQLQQILDAIIANKSSAEKNEYSATTPSQKQNQADLDSAEASINADTAEARTSTINIFKNFTLPGDIMKGMLSVTKIFNAMCNCIPFAPIILNFSLAVGAAAFLLGLSAWTIGKFGGRNK